uniref:Integrase catalytic domain-containing protein n=1 Tax=Fagus sylvatica TaxID=28930 RepID=A0A2N9EQA9_FAGSY
MLSPALPSHHRQKSGCLRCQEADSSPNRLATTLGSPSTGLRSRHLWSRWKDLEKLDPTAQESTPYDVERAFTRRPKFWRRHPRFSCYRTPIMTPPPPLERSQETRPNRARINLIGGRTRPHAPSKVPAPSSLFFTRHVSPSAMSALVDFDRVDLEVSLWLKVKFLSLFTGQSNQKNSHLICAFYKHRGHTIDRCNMRAGIIQRSAALTTSESVPSSNASSFDPVSLTTPTYSIADLQALFNFACCNHLTDNPHLTSAHTPPVLPTITTADGSTMTDSRTGQIVGTARKVGRLFELTSLHFPSSSVSTPVIAAFASIELWHSRLGHVSLPRIQTLVSRGLLGSVSSGPLDYMPCQLGKQPALPFNNSESIASATFDLIHSDIWGPSPVPTTQYSKAIKVFRFDNAREYRQTDFSTILKHYGTIFHTSCAGTSQQNGRAERKLCHILDTVRALTNAASTPALFWGESALTAVYIINRCPSPVVQNTTSYERLFGTASNYSLLKVFGCVCFVLLQPHEHTKLQPRSQLCCFLGYGLEEKGYRCYDPVAKRLQVFRHVVFWEHKMFYSLPLFSAGNSDSQADSLPNLFLEIPSPSAESVNPISNESPPADPSSNESPTADPTFNESPLSAPAANPINTITPEPRCSHRLQMGVQVKTRSDGTVDRYKALLVAKGFTQEYGIDYEHVVSMEEFHSRKAIRREAGETSNGATTEEAQTQSKSIHTNSLAERLKMVMEAGKNARNQSSTPKIQKVIFLLRDHKDFVKYYEPRVVSLGPIHHGKPKYQLGEKYKLVLTYEFMEGNYNTMEEAFNKIREKIKELRECFEEEVTKEYGDEALTWLLFVDGCAILQFILLASRFQ